jgi:hypothetical protein
MSANFLLVAMIVVAKEVAKVATEEEVAMTVVKIEEVAVMTVVTIEEVVVTEIVAQAEIAKILLKKDADFLVN